jgi:hypothetical protein
LQSNSVELTAPLGGEWCNRSDHPALAGSYCDVSHSSRAPPA